ncbi:HAMP domain-containing sensor histidine kinase [Clostridium cavendishii]|uniref:HAMP domain-containing sensor histidine kinase n=1 Tax=Clostridium cavendishii TaxID=349931 RepID=UPI000932F200|nr:HAMP domain-containing sensor histidine kinase [Clostridium cavendishii]
MVTKLRSSKLVRFIGIFMVAISISTMLAYVAILSTYNYADAKSFYETSDFYRLLGSEQNFMLNTLDFYKGKEKVISLDNIKSTDLFTDYEVKSAFKDYNKDYEIHASNVNRAYDSLKKEAIEKKYTDRIVEIEKEREEELNDVKKHYYTSEEDVRKNLEKSKEDNFKSSIRRYHETPVKYIMITEDGRTFTNIKEADADYIIDKTKYEYKKSNDFFIVLRKENLDDSTKINESSYDKKAFDKFLNYYSDDINALKENKIKLMGIFVKEDDLARSGYASNKDKYDLYTKNSKVIGYAVKGAVLACILGLAILVFSKVKEESKLQKIYKWLYFELDIGLQCGGIYIGLMFTEILYSFFGWRSNWIHYEVLIALSLYIIFEYYLLVFFINSLKDIMKSKKFKQKILLYVLFKKCRKFIKDILDYKDTRFKFIIFAVFTFIFILISLVVASELYMWGWHDTLIIVFILYTLSYFGCLFLYGFKFMKHLNKILDGTNKISEGDLNYTIEEKGVNILGKLAKNINNLKSGLKDALGKEMKSERMKSELITNVSHDLKTPLTSIINYVDLLKKEELESQKANDYIAILDRKSQRLKALIEDLFEASKATSGALDMNIEKIEITELLKQTLAELDEKIVTSRLNFKVNLGVEKIYAMGDGRRTYRVFENLIQNILKYSLAGTRVYIDLIKEESSIKLVMKNIAAYEMNFDATEIAERFKRGDLSRNTEGSGLGLAIAKSIMELQNGKLDLEVDGDLFKATVVFYNV